MGSRPAEGPGADGQMKPWGHYGPLSLSRVIPQWPPPPEPLRTQTATQWGPRRGMGSCHHLEKEVADVPGAHGGAPAVVNQPRSVDGHMSHMAFVCQPKDEIWITRSFGQMASDDHG